MARLNYRNAVISNGLSSQQSEVNASYDGGAPNQQVPTFPNILPSANSPLFQAAPDISLDFTAVPGAIHSAGEFAN